MVRFARVVAPGIAHHITQRGNARRFILEGDDERKVYLDLLQQSVQRHGVELIGYCLMSNHVHLVAIPHGKDALARSLKDTHGRFASYWNAVNHSSGHVWQGRYYSCPLDGGHLWEALRYTELNPVRAGLLARASDWPWSSAAVATSYLWGFATRAFRPPRWRHTSHLIQPGDGRAVTIRYETSTECKLSSCYEPKWSSVCVPFGRGLGGRPPF